MLLLGVITPVIPAMDPKIRVLCSNVAWFIFGTGFFAAGGIISMYHLGLWMMGNPMHLRPSMLLGLVFILVSFQFISLGLIAELVVAGRHPEDAFRVAKRV